MRISFVVLAGNEAACLPACIESIQREIAAARQSYGLLSDAELIVVNNASTCRRRQIALSFPGVKVVDEPRRGLPYARQAGYAASTMELIANVDAGCRLPAGWIRTVIESFESDDELAAISGPMVYYSVTQEQDVPAKSLYLSIWISYAINRYVLRAGSWIQGGNFAVRRSAMEAIGGFDRDSSVCGDDKDTARRLNEVGDVQFTPALKMFSSAQRLSRGGMLHRAVRYSVSHRSTSFLKRPLTPAQLEIRNSCLSNSSLRPK